MVTPEATGASSAPDSQLLANPHDAQAVDIAQVNVPDNHEKTAKRPGAGGSNPAVRFASVVEEITPSAAAPATPGDVPGDVSGSGVDEGTDAINEVMSDQIKELSSSLHAADLQGRRLNGFSFEPYSLPASRIPSREDHSGGSSRIPTPNQRSPRLGPMHQMQSPPLTPSGTISRDAEARKTANRQDTEKAASTLDSSMITPQASSSRDATSPPSGKRPLPPRSASSDHVSRDLSGDGHRSHRRGVFDIGPGGSTPASRESSPSRASQFYSKPMTPHGDVNDPYAANKRQPQTRFPDRGNIESRFQFSKRKPGHASPPSGSSSSLARSEKRHSGFLGGHKKLGDDLHDDAASSHSRQSSFADLKRFFNKGHHQSKKDKRPPSQSGRDSGTRTPPSSRSGQQRQPFGDDHGLISKYGKLGKILGSGAGGKVRLMKRHEDGVVFAVKEFRERYNYESQKEYVKRLTAEFCVGSTLHHGNIIETLDILQEKERWYQVMEYAPYDLFAIVMTGKMSRAEITCAFLQILNGVTYLHSSGLAHRDLKLDNVVVSEKGIMKLIDFGSSHVFKYPFESGVIQAKGIVGSDPYLAPEVLTEPRYDAQAVDIWSLAIIFCCMSLRRFPWKVPKMTDNSFKLFAADPTPGHDPKKLAMPSKSTNDLTDTRPRDFLPVEDDSMGKPDGHANRQSPPGQPSRASGEVSSKAETKDNAASQEKGADPSSAPTTKNETSGGAGGGAPHDKKEVIRGPWRVLRVLPRESRHIIGRMLAVKPEERATMEEVLQDPWVANSEICQQLGPGGEVKSAENHSHVLELPQPPPGSSN